MQDMGTETRDSHDALLSENAQLRSRLEHLEAIIEKVPAMLYTSNNSKKAVNWCNVRLTDTLGYTREEVLTLGTEFFRQVTHPDDMSILAISQQKFSESKGMFGGVMRVRRKNDQEWFWVVGLGLPFTFDAHGNVVDVICVFLDFSNALDTGNQITEALRVVLRRRNEDVLNKLTAREKDIFMLAARGFNNKEIAERLNLSRYTVETHRKNIRLKLKVRNTPELVALARQIGVQ
ncbi:LuxR C-terminal-related transcriptional regulator [Chitinophaga sp.]|uniref:LuxR C-terminal-related transcriptional regulator n=1 Tax=Chitinophaga sp. TaxID=1869181 RepID=UPI00262A5BE1|nr:LuxR C-terminal-related transcriptional regulator [uncultured Chitinophaga sp.]